MTKKQANPDLITGAVIVGFICTMIIISVIFGYLSYKPKSAFEECVDICTEPYYESENAEDYCLEECFDNLDCITQSSQRGKE